MAVVVVNQDHVVPGAVEQARGDRGAEASGAVHPQPAGRQVSEPGEQLVQRDVGGAGNVAGGALAPATASTSAPLSPISPSGAPVSLFQQVAGHDHALDLVGALVDLGDRGPDGSFRRWMTSGAAGCQHRFSTVSWVVAASGSSGRRR